MKQGMVSDRKNEVVLSMKKNILVLLPINDKQKQRLKTVAGNFVFRSVQTVTKQEVQDANIIIGNVPVSLIGDVPNLELLQLNSAGTGKYIEKGILPVKTILTNATGAYGLALAEHTLALVMALLKNLHHYRDNQNQNQWKDEGKVKSISGSTTLVVGLGNIGGEFASRMHVLGSSVIGIRRTGTKKPDYLKELCHLEDLDRLLPEADIVAICLPETKETYHLFNKERLEKMKQDAILVNVGRGSVVDTDALCDVLESGWLWGAAMDVTDPEPLPDNHRLWNIKNTIITPHIAGDFHLTETLNRLVELSAWNLNACLNGKELKNVVDFSTGYRKLSE